MNQVAQQLLNAGLPLQAATQLGLWAQKSSGVACPPSALPIGDEQFLTGTARPASALSLTRSSAVASPQPQSTFNSRPHSSIGLSRALSPAVDLLASVESKSPPKSPAASMVSSAPTNVIARSYRDVEHRTRLLQRAKTSSARLAISSQPLVVPNVPPP
jgi:hypothetical protein